MPQYRQPAKAQAAALNAQATAEYTRGQKAGSTSDNYIRTTVYLATVLFLAGLGGHFGYRVIRYGLAACGHRHSGPGHRRAGNVPGATLRPDGSPTGLLRRSKVTRQ